VEGHRFRCDLPDPCWAGRLWRRVGLVQFSPQPISLAPPFLAESAPPVLVFVINIALAATVVTIFSVRTAAGEEIGWRGFMLTRLIDAGVPMPVLVSGVIWGLWHVPLILGGVYLTGPPPALAALLWMIVVTSFSFVFARLRLETGSVWPAITLHAAWNSIIQAAFDAASTGASATLWVGESGILVALTMIAAAIVTAHLANTYTDDLIRAGKLEAVLCDYELPPSTTHIVYPSRDRLPYRMRLLIDFLVARFDRER
jgi:membrane protease YdiL (CAAX protease family)